MNTKNYILITLLLILSSPTYPQSILTEIQTIDAAISWLDQNLHYKNENNWDRAPDLDLVIEDGYGDCKMLAGVACELLNSIGVANEIFVIKKRYWHMFVVFKYNDHWRIIDNARLKKEKFATFDDIKKAYKVKKIVKRFSNYNDFREWFNNYICWKKY